MEPSWKQADLFPVIARVIQQACGDHEGYISAHCIANRLLQDSEARPFIEEAQRACPFQREASYFPPVNRLRLKCNGGPRGACPFQREASYFPPVNRLRLKCDGGPRAGLVDLRKMDKLAQLTGSTCAMLMAWALANNMMLELLSRNGTGRNWNAAWRKSRPITSASAPITIA